MSKEISLSGHRFKVDHLLPLVLALTTLSVITIGDFRQDISDYYDRVGRVGFASVVARPAAPAPDIPPHDAADNQVAVTDNMDEPEVLSDYVGAEAAPAAQPNPAPSPAVANANENSNVENTPAAENGNKNDGKPKPAIICLIDICL